MNNYFNLIINLNVELDRFYYAFKVLHHAIRERIAKIIYPEAFEIIEMNNKLIEGFVEMVSK